MKKILVAVLAISSLSAFADHHQMVRLDGCADGQCDTLDFGMDSNDAAGNSAYETKTQTLSFNYAYNFTGYFGAGLTYVSSNTSTDGKVGSVGDKSSMVGVNLYYNMAGKWSGSSFFGLHYNMTTVDDSDAGNKDGNSDTDIVVEYGHRHKLGKLAGVEWHWSPSVTYTMGTSTPNADGGKDTKTTELALNAANFAVTF